MTPELKQKWLEALRSGEYKQGTGALERHYAHGLVTNCCLGVLAHVCGIEAKPIDHAETGEPATSKWAFDFEDTGSTEWTGMPSDDWLESIGLDNHRAYTLASMNDRGYDFDTIAKYIEEKV